MEEQVGQIWHKLITRAAATAYPEAAVKLTEISKSVGVLFRALGGDGGLRIEATAATKHGARRNWLQRIAGTHQQIELCWLNAEALQLPAQIDLFPTKALNRDLYLWLAALAAGNVDQSLSWFQLNQQLTQQTLQRFPGLQSRYSNLVDALLALRPDLSRLRPDEAAAERAIQQALRQPGSVAALPAAKRPPQPIPLWLHPSPHRSKNSVVTDQSDGAQSQQSSSQTVEQRRRRGERTEMPDGKKGILAFRLESLLTLADYVKVDRCTDDEDDDKAAKQALEDMDKVSVARDNKPVTTSLRFDLDLPAAEYDDTPLGSGILLPEWDYKRQSLRPDHCCLQPMLATTAQPAELPAHLKRTAQRLRRQFEALMPTRIWHKGQADGPEIDLEAYLLHQAERRQGHVSAERGLYRDFRKGSRDLACLLLADFSLSTDAWINNKARVIEVIQDSLFLFAESLNATGDQFAMYGFSSRYRSHVRFHTLKTFEQNYDATVRGRIQAIKPGYYTRMGAAIRYASRLLSQQKVSQPLLLLLTDGKPNDLDQYEGRYGVEDTRMALHEARKLGLQPFCVTIDEKAKDYLPHLFGTQNYVVIRNPSELPRELPLLYARLT
ncbi:MAG: nitric oxide reductase [Candidatus Parabeggiatoa sp. nov. 3]|nr:MAG: nitric oxide reductase [Gammaproteobacteria bacterium]HEW97209.1 VWA domain-containing protein [Beggiatoa sp.]